MTSNIRLLRYPDMIQPVINSMHETLQKLLAAELLKKFPAFREPKGSLPCKI
jgi:hypothetical protein